MTVDFLWQEALFPSKDITRNGWKSLSELKGRTLGVDLSYWLHKALVQSTVAIKLHFDTEPIKMFLQHIWMYLRTIPLSIHL